MKAGILLRYSPELLIVKEDLKQKIENDFKKEQRKLIIKDSIRVLKWDRREGYDADDFMLNMFSVVYTGRCYKIPRIVKKILLNERTRS
jgi:hypothetical protein